MVDVPQTSPEDRLVTAVRIAPVMPGGASTSIRGLCSWSGIGYIHSQFMDAEMAQIICSTRIAADPCDRMPLTSACLSRWQFSAGTGFTVL